MEEVMVRKYKLLKFKSLLHFQIISEIISAEHLKKNQPSGNLALSSELLFVEPVFRETK